MMDPKRHILVVDDDGDTATFLFAVLEAEGYHVATRTHPLEALKYVAKTHPPLVISDVRMPDINGFDLLSKIRFLSPQTHVILMTAFGEEGSEAKMLQRGGDELVTKPFDRKVLLAAVRRALDPQPESQFENHGGAV